MYAEKCPVAHLALFLFYWHNYCTEQRFVDVLKDSTCHLDWAGMPLFPASRAPTGNNESARKERLDGFYGTNYRDQLNIVNRAYAANNITSKKKTSGGRTAAGNNMLQGNGGVGGNSETATALAGGWMAHMDVMHR